jgi:hypothetical protein
MGPGETVAELRVERFDPAARALRGSAYEVLDQLVIDHLLGAVG